MLITKIVTKGSKKNQIMESELMTLKQQEQKTKSEIYLEFTRFKLVTQYRYVLTTCILFEKHYSTEHNRKLKLESEKELGAFLLKSPYQHLIYQDYTETLRVQTNEVNNHSNTKLYVYNLETLDVQLNRVKFTPELINIDSTKLQKSKKNNRSMCKCVPQIRNVRLVR